MRRAGVEPTTSSARTSPRCLRGGPRRSLYKRQHTLEDKGDLDSEKKSVQKSVQKSREFCFLACQKSHGMPQKKEKGFSMIVEISCYVFFFDSNILFTCALYSIKPSRSQNQSKPTKVRRVYYKTLRAPGQPVLEDLSLSQRN